GPASGAVTLVSPSPLALARGETALLVIGAERDAIESVTVEARTPAGTWAAPSAPTSPAKLATTPAGPSPPPVWPPKLAATDQIRVRLRLSAATRIRHLALYPRAAS